MKKLLLFIGFIPVIFIFPQSYNESWKIYDDSEVARIDITIDPSFLEWMYEDENLLSDSLHFASMHFKNKWIAEDIDSIGFRLRGNTSRASDKKSFKVSFNTFVTGREYYGLDKLNLNGEHNDPSIIRSKLCWDLFKEMGIISSRAAYAEVYINNNYYGLYISVEHVDDEFLTKNFADDSGNLWKCLYPADLVYKEGDDPELYKSFEGGRRTYDLKTNENDDNYFQLARLINIINNIPDNLLQDSLGKILDVPEVLQNFALNILTGSWDNYWSLRNNYYLYHNPDEDQFHLIPYDYDNAFSIDWFGVDWATIDPYSYHLINPGNRPLAERLLNNPQYRNLYTHFMDFYNENLFKLSLWEARIDSLKNLITPFIEPDTFRTKDYDFTVNDFHQSFTVSGYSNQHVKKGIKEFINDRYNSLPSQLNYIDANPFVYSIDFFPKIPSATDSIYVIISAFSEDGISDLSIEFSDKGSDETDIFPMNFQPILNTKKVEEADRWIGIIPPLGSGVSGEFKISITDMNQNEVLYPLHKAITIQTPQEINGEIIINEFMASNSTTIADDSSDYEDWIELYNPTSENIIISGMYLTDKTDNLTKWQFPGENLVINAGEYLLIWCDEEQEEGDFHTNFKLSADGEFIALTASDGITIIDSISFVAQTIDISFGRFPDAEDNWDFFSSPTPGSSNIITSINNNKNKPVNFELFQNYPNPFNPTTKIKYTITTSPQTPLLGKERGRGEVVTLKVYDILGNEVAILVNETKPSGEYEVEFNALNLSSGIYFYRIQAGNFVQTKKMILMK